MKLSTLTLLLVATADTALADKKLFYNCYNYHQSTKDYTKNHKFGGFISDAFMKTLEENMPTWSNHKYKTAYNPWSRAGIFVECSNRSPSIEEAIESIAEQEKIVKEWIVKEGETLKEGD